MTGDAEDYLDALEKTTDSPRLLAAIRHVRETCRHWVGGDQKFCGAQPTRRYMEGDRCKAHSPAVMAGREEA